MSQASIRCTLPSSDEQQVSNGLKTFHRSCIFRSPQSLPLLRLDCTHAYPLHCSTFCGRN
jgi:hypothetical protein